MARDEIKSMVDASKRAVQKEFEDAAKSVRDELDALKKRTLDKV